MRRVELIRFLAKDQRFCKHDFNHSNDASFKYIVMKRPRVMRIQYQSYSNNTNEKWVLLFMCTGKNPFLAVDVCTNPRDIYKSTLSENTKVM